MRKPRLAAAVTGAVVWFLFGLAALPLVAILGGLSSSGASRGARCAAAVVITVTRG